MRPDRIRIQFTFAVIISAIIGAGAAPCIVAQPAGPAATAAGPGAAAARDFTGRAAAMDLAGMVTLAGGHAAGRPQARSAAGQSRAPSAAGQSQARSAAAMKSGREGGAARAQPTQRPARAAGGHAGKLSRASAGHAARLTRASARHRLSPQQTARSLLSGFGWSPGQFRYLSLLWARESGWNQYAANPASGAYGIPQAVPGSKMASAGADWRWNARTQIRWGLSYIAARYGSPAGAWQHESAYGWY